MLDASGRWQRAEVCPIMGTWDLTKADAMPTVVSRDEVRRLVDAGAHLVEVLPMDEYDEEHLPGAINLPLKALTRESVDAALEPGRPVIVYCWDAL